MHLRAEIFFVRFGIAIMPFGVVIPHCEVQLLNYVCCLCFTRLAMLLKLQIIAVVLSRESTGKLS